ncbi:MAG: LCP family protein [Acidaminococcaceae bacterium]|nr:LCP family protein [Acidaminococcaceae bacterium]
MERFQEFINQKFKPWWQSIAVGDKICALAVLFILVASYFYIQEQTALQEQRSADSLKREERLSVRKNVVVLGVDQLVEVDNGQRTDTIFVMMFDPEKGQCSLLNVPRDTRVQMEVDGKPDYDKVNAAFTYGGAKNTMRVLEEFLGIQIDHYLLVDVSGFKRLVDAIGGVDIYVDKDMKYDDFKQGLHIDLKAGQQHLDGEHAMQYVRYRREYGDISRIRRQQRFLWAVQQKIVSGQMLMKIPGLTRELMNMVRTNLSVSDILSMARTLYDMVRNNAFRMSMVPGSSEYLYDIAYWTPHVMETRQMVADLQGVLFEGRLVEAATILAETYSESVHKGRVWQREHDAAEEWDRQQKLLEEHREALQKQEAEKLEQQKQEKNKKKRRSKHKNKDN